MEEIPPRASVTYFEENGLSFNADAGEGQYLLPNGVSTFSIVGEDYQINDCEREVIMKKDHLYNGSVYDIEFYYTAEWSSGTGDHASVMTKSYTVYMPEEYDGLTFMAIPQADNYKDNEKMGFMGDIYPGALLLDIDLVDAYNCLLFRI